MLHNIVKKLSTGSVFHDQIQLFLGLDNLIELNHMRVLYDFQNVNFSRNSFVVSYVQYFVFL